MGTSYVKVGTSGFWISDSVLELWLRFLALHVEDPAEPHGIATEIRDQWLLSSRGFFMGCIPDGLEKALSTPEGAALVRDAIHSLLSALRDAPPRLDKAVLNLMRFSGRFEADVETRILIDIGQKFLDLVEQDSYTGHARVGSR